MIKTICDSVNQTCFPKEDHLPDWVRRNNKVTKGDRVEHVAGSAKIRSNFSMKYSRIWNVMAVTKRRRQASYAQGTLLEM